MSIKQSNSHPDQQYIEGLVNGDQKTILSIYEKYFPMIKAYVQKNRGQYVDAEDLFYSTLEIIYLQARDGLIIQQSFGAYFKLICQRRWLNRLGRAQRMVHNLDDQLEPSIDPEVVKQLEIKERELLYHKHFKQLPERCREILQLSFEGKNYRKIAEVLQLNYSFVRRRGCECANQLMENIQQDPMFNELK